MTPRRERAFDLESFDVRMASVDEKRCLGSVYAHTYMAHLHSLQAYRIVISDISSSEVCETLMEKTFRLVSYR